MGRAKMILFPGKEEFHYKRKMKELNRETTNKTETLPIRVMQFGGGNFLRAFVDWMVQILNEETDFNGGIAVVKPTERGDYQTLKSQDGLFTVVLDGIKNGNLVAEKKLVNCVQQVINPYSEWDAYLKLAENEDLRFMVSNTTEAGIKFNANDTSDDKPPKEFPAKLTLWLYHRFQHFQGNASKGCILLPCELIENNGDVLKETILRYADHWQLEDEFKKWVDTSNHFCSTLVDRIVSGFPTARAEEIQKELGYKDRLLVAGEYYHSWIIQGPESIEKELPFGDTDLNVEFVKDLAPYREMKVRVLNGAHTAMVPVAYLANLRLVSEAMDDADVERFVKSLLLQEVGKTLDFPKKVIHKFVAAVLDRFRNPKLKHQLISISLNSTSKFAARLLPTLKDYRAEQGQLPERIVFGLAALIRFNEGEWQGKKIEVKDDEYVQQFIDARWKEFRSKEVSLHDTVKKILENPKVWGEDLNRIPGLAAMVSDFLSEIEKKGIRPVLKTIA